MAEILSQVIHLDGCTVHILECGEAKGLSIVLLHGMKFQAQTWQDLGTLAFLAAQGMHVVAVDMPGFGKSPACAKQPVAVLESLLEQKLPGPVVLVGPSMGGRIALEFAISNPGRLAGLVVAGAVGVQENQSHLATIDVPTLVVWGADDQVSPLANSDILLANIPNATRVVFPDASHPCYLDQPDRWHQSLQSFLTKLAH